MCGFVHATQYPHFPRWSFFRCHPIVIAGQMIVLRPVVSRRTSAEYNADCNAYARVFPRGRFPIPGHNMPVNDTGPSTARI